MMPALPDKYEGEESPTGDLGPARRLLRVQSGLADLPALEQEAAFSLLANWCACGTEARRSLEWTARLLAERARA
jgi:hypothetical protein